MTEKLPSARTIDQMPPEGERTKAEEWEAMYAALFRQLQPILGTLMRYRLAASRMRDKWAEGDDAVKKSLWQDLHEIEDDALDVITEAQPLLKSAAQLSGIALWQGYCEKKMQVETLQEVLQRLVSAADAVGVKHFDTDTMSPEVTELQEATESAKKLL